MAYLNNYEPYGHGNANTEPAGDINSNIVGLELEIEELYNTDAIEDLIYTGHIETSDSGTANIQMEYEDDGGVEYELIFNADSVEKIKNRVEMVSDCIAGDCSTSEGTSAHIHLNKNYLDENGLNGLDILKAAESIAPLIYKVSGRNGEYWRRWCDSYADQDNTILHCINVVDNIDPASSGHYDNRYKMVNLTNSATVEIRAFSNAFNFDTAAISLYIDLAAELIPTIARNMKGLNYQKHPGIIFQNLEDFFSTRPDMVRRFHLKNLISYETARHEAAKLEIMATIDQHRRTQTRIQYISGEPLEKAARIIYILENEPNLTSGFSGRLDLNNLAPAIEELERENARRFLSGLF